MKLSACYIVRDEDKELEKSLQSINGHVDEIIVIDTGGTDAMRQIASQYNGKYFLYTWGSDFAAARNFALDQASGSWVLFLDADEYIVQEKRADIHQILAEKNNNVDVLLVKLVNIDEDDGGRIIDYFYAPRIFRRSKDIRYNGKIHEQLLKQNKPITAVKALPEKEVCIYHTGYSSHKLIQKAQRNLALLLNELKNSLEPEKLYLYLAEAYDGIGDAENALKYARLDIALGRRNITFASRSYRICLRILERQMVPDAEEIRRLAKQAALIFPEVPEFHAEYAQWLAEEFEYDAAIYEMQEAIKRSNVVASLVEPTIFDPQASQMAESLIKQWRQIQVNQRELRISACAIVKNEAAEIGRWIANMKLCTDEQIIVDTGSTDDTVKIAREAGANIFHFEWNDDFSAAKNFAVEQANGNWIAFLDADEFFCPDIIGNVRKVVAREHLRSKEVDAILCPIINIDEDKNNVEISRFMNLRIFRNEPYLRYYGNIHEGIRHNNAELRVFIEKKFLQIYHTGYSSNRIEKKLQRNLDLLQQDIDRNGEGIQHYRYLMDCYQGLGEHEKAIKYAKLHLQSNASSIGSESDIYRTLINSMVFIKKNSEEVRKYMEEAIERFPDMPDFYAYYAADCFRNEQFAKAKEYLLKALAIYDNSQNDSIEASSFSYILSEVYSYLAEIYWREGERKDFVKYIGLALQNNRYNCQAFAQLWRLLENEDFAIKVTMLDQYYAENKKDIGFLVQEIEKYSVDELYFYYTEKLKGIAGVFNEKVPLYRLIKNGEIDELYQQALQQSITKVHMLSYAALQMKELSKMEDVKKLLPAGIWNCIKSYHEGALRLGVDDYDGYRAVLPFVVHMGNREICQKFLQMADGGTTEQALEISHVLEQESCWEEMAKILFSLLARGTESVEILQKMGEALFNCAQYDKAEIYLKRAKEKGTSSKMIDMYLSWIEEKRERRV